MEMKETLNLNLLKVIKAIPLQIRINSDLIDIDCKTYKEINVFPISSAYKHLWSKTFMDILNELDGCVKYYQEIIPEFELEITVFPVENYFSLKLNHTSKSVIDKQLLENRNCYLFQSHNIAPNIRYTNDQDFSWNNYRIYFCFEYHL